MVINKNEITKIRLLKSLKRTKFFSLHKISIIDYLKWNESSISFKYHPEIKKEDIISISKYVSGGLNFEPWIQIVFNAGENITKEIYITSGKLFESFTDNDKIENELKIRYLINH